MPAPEAQAAPSREAADSKIIRLEAIRQLVAEKFPDAVRETLQQSFEKSKGLESGALTEVFGSSGGISLFLQKAIVESGGFAAWIDASDSLDPADFPPECLRRLLWVRCCEVGQAVQAADFLLRDGNVPLLVLDLRRTKARQLQKIPASTWHRFQRILEEGTAALGVATTRPCISAARLRIRLTNRWALRDLLRLREELVGELQSEAVHRGATVAFHQRIA